MFHFCWNKQKLYKQKKKEDASDRFTPFTCKKIKMSEPVPPQCGSCNNATSCTAAAASKCSSDESCSATTTYDSAFYDKMIFEEMGITRDLLKQMVVRENYLRTCDETQAKFSAADRVSDGGIIAIVEELQRQVAREFLPQYCHDSAKIERAVEFLRCAANMFPEDEYFQTVPIYVKYNRCQNGPLEPGHTIPLDVNLLELATTVTSMSQATGIMDNAEQEALYEKNHTVMLQSKFNPDRPIVLVGGSYSWPPLRQLVPDLHAALSKYSAIADFLCIYILEAQYVQFIVIVIIVLLIFFCLVVAITAHKTNGPFQALAIIHLANL